VPKNYAPIFNGDDAGGHVTPCSDVWFENERAMWWAEFDGVGEEAVRNSMERNSYTPTGMEVARQWLVRREFLQLREDVQSIRATAEQAQEAAYESLRIATEAFALVSRADTNSRTIAEMAATAKKRGRTLVFVGTVASLSAVCATVMVLASSQQAAPNTKQASARPPPPPKETVVWPPPPAVPSPETRQAWGIRPGNAEKKQPSHAPQISSPDRKNAGRSLAETRHTSAVASESAQREQPSNTTQINPLDPKPQGQSVVKALALVADQVAGAGTIDFTAQVHDMATGRDHSEQLSFKASNVTFDPKRCAMAYQWHIEQDGRAVSDQDRTVDLRLAKSIRVTSIDYESGRGYLVRTFPKVYVVHIARGEDSPGSDLYFRDEETAARVGTAAKQAVEFCDNGEQQSRGR
jgi:hypothetical protein